MLDQLIQITTRLAGYNPYAVLFEMAVIWVGVFMVWRFLRGTRGARVLKGVGLIVITALMLIALLGTDRIGFERLRWLLENFIGIAALAMVIVFQPELRRALGRLGEAQFFRSGGEEQEAVIDEVVRAVSNLSKNKIGAILAIERAVGLKAIIEAGTPLNADVTAELLRTIFWPGTALHDMGVVIRNGQVVAAGVQFPLAEGGDLGQELGSRHRAAVGLSEEADCLVIVVSEETGAISLAERGQLLRKLSPDGLRAMLRRALLRPPRRSLRTTGRARASGAPRRRRSDGKRTTAGEAGASDKNAA